MLPAIKPILLLVLTTLTFISQATPARELPPQPLSIKNQNPFIQIFGLPTTQPAILLSTNRTALDIAFDTANNSIINKVVGNEVITLDGESIRLSFTLRRAIGNHTEIGAELPLVGHHNGILDNFIEGWHKMLGLSNTERNQSPSNVLNYAYTRDGATVLNIQSPENGLGDIRLFGARQLHNDDRSALSLHVSLKLPTGDANRLNGSGATDLAISAAYSHQYQLSRWQYNAFFNGGVLLLGDSDKFANIQRRSVLFGSAGVIWNATSNIDIIAQLDSHAGFYRSALDQLSNNTLQLTVGGVIHLTSTTQLDIGVGENLFTDTTPDFLLNIALKQHY